MAYCSKRGEFISRLERLVWRIAPNARNAALKQVVTHRIPTGVYTFSSRGPVAQWIERLPPEQKVVGSNPIRPTFDFLLSLLSLLIVVVASAGVDYNRVICK